MSQVGQVERMTQNRLAGLLREQLQYDHLGVWKDRENNRNVEPELLRLWLSRRGVSDALIQKVLAELERRTAVGGVRSLYDANREIYDALRYGVKVSPGPGEQTETVWLIDWKHPENNDFQLAEEVTVIGENTKRPDIVLYVNGIALALFELKRSSITVSEGIRQNLDSQRKEFIRPFFSTVQFLFAGNDTEGLRYGAIETREKYYLEWKEAPLSENKLDSGVLQLCEKRRFLELIHDYIVFDAGTKKLCRHNQYFGVKAAQARMLQREGGIIWHTQGSGKSLTMVWLAKWIRENVENARVLIITDRTELDGQIERVFKGVDEDILRTKSGAHLVDVLNSSTESLVCSLIQKFGAREEGNVDDFLRDIEAHLPKDFRVKGEMFVFIDECHRTQSGKLHQAMKQLIPNATVVGFTGTPLLHADKQSSLEVFGTYIHQYRYNEAVRDGVVLDLRYEARDINQTLDSPEQVDQWFDAKTRGMTEVAKAHVKKRWGTMQSVLSAKQRLERIVFDICLDMETKQRLLDGHGNAILVSDSIYNACRFYEFFQQTALKGHCAIVTSYSPTIADVKGEETGEGTTAAIQQYETYRRMLSEHFDEPQDTAADKAELFEEEVKKRFIEEPGQMKLLIVVDKLLTGFDAPPATYLYIDKKMRDHGLFQAICRVNRLDDEGKDYGYVVDYMDLFKSLESAIHDYTGEALSGFDVEDVAGLLKNRLEMARQVFEESRESIRALCEPVGVEPTTQEYVRFFCPSDETELDKLSEYERRRVHLYKLASKLARAYADLAAEATEAGYSDAEANAIKREVEHYTKASEEIRLASGDYVDMKALEPAMRQLLDTFVRADGSERLTNFDDLTLVELLVREGPGAVDQLPEGLRGSQDAIAETIENNVRKVIIEESAVNPKYYERMSQLLDSLMEARRNSALDYKQYLARVAELAKQVTDGGTPSNYPAEIATQAQRALYDNLDRDADFVLRVDKAIRDAILDGWRENAFKQRAVRRAIASVAQNEAKTQAIFELAVAQRGY
jgi:type I restriction enzyme R subunit